MTQPTRQVTPSNNPYSMFDSPSSHLSVEEFVDDCADRYFCVIAGVAFLYALYRVVTGQSEAPSSEQESSAAPSRMP